MGQILYFYFGRIKILRSCSFGERCLKGNDLHTGTDFMTQWNYLPVLGWGGPGWTVSCISELVGRSSSIRMCSHTRQPLSTPGVCIFFPLNSSFEWGQSFNGEVRLTWGNRVCRADRGVMQRKESQLRWRESSWGRSAERSAEEP